jgi:hypothetical protein
MHYTGSCHCGAVAFEVEGDLSGGAVACNCSICTAKGALLCAVPRDALSVTAPEEGLGTYSFHKHAIAHRFCKTCGIHPFAEDLNATGSPMAYINIRCLDGIDLASVPVMEFDGRSM